MPSRVVQEKNLKSVMQRLEESEKLLSMKLPKRVASKSNLSVSSVNNNLNGLRRESTSVTNGGGNSPSKGLTRESSVQSLNRALKSFLNPAGPGDYNIPSCFGNKSIEGSKRNMPSISFKERRPIPPTREFANLYVGRHSPGMVYDVHPDNHRFRKL